MSQRFQKKNPLIQNTKRYNDTKNPFSALFIDDKDDIEEFKRVDRTVKLGGKTEQELIQA